jgi:hypothetical protein
MTGLGLGLRLGQNRGTAAAFTPAALFAASSGLAFDPTNTSSVYQDSTGTTPGAVSSPVGKVLDQSGNNNHATQATAASRPLLVSSSGVQCLQLDGVDDRLALPDFITGFTSGMAIFAAKLNADPPASGFGPVIGDFGSSAQGNHYPFGDGIVYSDFLSTTRKTCGNPTPSLAAWHVGEFRSATGAWAYAINGTNVFTTATNTVGTTTGLFLGATTAGGARILGLIGRIIIINRVLTGTELANARTWVGAGSGLVL